MSEPRTHAQARMEWETRKHNQELQNTVYCRECRRSVPQRDFGTKFAAAGGILAGPFCSETCYWAFLCEQEYNPRELRENHYGT